VELPGFQSQGVATATGAAAFVAYEGLPPSGLAKEVARLNRAAFVAGAIEHLGSPAGVDALSVADRFRTPAAARAEVSTQATQPPVAGVKQTNFTVPGIPGARGFDDSSARSQGHNIAFTVGPYYYLVGVGSLKGAANPPSRADLAAAAKRLYARVHH
jgi:hypothetical protein